MDIYYTIEEKYLQAVDEINYGETPKGMQLLNDIISNDPLHARAHYQLGIINYYDLKDYQAAGYHFKTCAQLQPSFPDVYYHYMHLLVFLNMEKQANALKAAALETPGVNRAAIFNFLGLLAERNQNLILAMTHYRQAFLESISKSDMDETEENMRRINLKVSFNNKYTYTIVE